MMIPFDDPIKQAQKQGQIAHLNEHKDLWTDERTIEDYFDEYYVQYEREGLESGEGQGELYKRCCADMGIEPKAELIGRAP